MERGPSYTNRRGTVMVLALTILVVLVTLGLTWFQVTREVRRDSQIVYYRLHATTALGNGLREAQALFQAKVNDAGVQPDAEDQERRDLARRRRQEGTGRNEDAWRRFQARNRRAADRRGEGKLDEERDEPSGADDEAVPPSEWYEAFRAATLRFQAAVPVPASDGLAAASCPGVAVEPVTVRVVSLEPPKSVAGRGLVTAGIAALRGVARVKGPGFRFARALEWHLPFRLVQPEPVPLQAPPPAPGAGSG